MLHKTITSMISNKYAQVMSPTEQHRYGPLEMSIDNLYLPELLRQSELVTHRVNTRTLQPTTHSTESTKRGALPFLSSYDQGIAIFDN